MTRLDIASHSRRLAACPSPSPRATAAPHRHGRLLRPLALALLHAGLGSAWAQTAAPATTPPQQVVVTGNPLRAEQAMAPVSVLTGDALVQQRGASLGETLDGMTGVSSTRFGPNADRPVIRGLDGDRLRILNNSGATLDASSLSFDHAVAIDPLVATRIEVLRGPAALLYGGNGIGGVVNVLDNRIPLSRLGALTGAVELRAGGASAERGAAAVLEGGRGDLAWHVDAYGRDTSNQKTPRFTPVEDGTPLDTATEVRNSASRSRGGAVGAAWFGAGGRVGIALDRFENRYGVVAEPDVTIDMARSQARLEAEFAVSGGWFTRWRGQAQLNRYEHREIEGDGAVGTTFRSRGGEWRLEAEHRAVAGWRGTWGVQLERFDFSALGEEAFVPDTLTRRTGLFALEELTSTAGVTAVGARLERSTVSSDGDPAGGSGRFGDPSSRRFSLASVSLSHRLPLGGGWQTTLSAGSSGRAPTYYELYANGVHAATGAYERGDTALPAERGRHLEWALERRDADGSLRAGLFTTRFSRFISLDASGTVVDGEGLTVPDGTDGATPLFEFRAVRARLWGAEAEWVRQGRAGALSWRSDLGFDLTRATNLDSGEPLPRVAPWRVRWSGQLSQGDWTARVDVSHAGRQDRVPAVDTPTDGYTLIDLRVSRRWRLPQADLLWFAKVGNVTQQLAYSAGATSTIRGLSPLPARAFSTGLRVGF